MFCNFAVVFTTAIYWSSTRHSGSHWRVQFLASILDGLSEFLILRIDQVFTTQTSGIIEFWFFDSPFFAFLYVWMHRTHVSTFLSVICQAWRSFVFLSVSTRTTFFRLAVSLQVQVSDNSRSPSTFQKSSICFSNNPSNDVCVFLVTSNYFSGIGNDSSLGMYSLTLGCTWWRLMKFLVVDQKSFLASASSCVESSRCGDGEESPPNSPWRISCSSPRSSKKGRVRTGGSISGVSFCSVFSKTWEVRGHFRDPPYARTQFRSQGPSKKECQGGMHRPFCQVTRTQYAGNTTFNHHNKCGGCGCFSFQGVGASSWLGTLQAPRPWEPRQWPDRKQRDAQPSESHPATERWPWGVEGPCRGCRGRTRTARRRMQWPSGYHPATVMCTGLSCPSVALSFGSHQKTVTPNLHNRKIFSQRRIRGVCLEGQVPTGCTSECMPRLQWLPQENTSK